MNTSLGIRDKRKKIGLLLCLTLSCFAITQAQDSKLTGDATLTKGETVEYIKKKWKELIGYSVSDRHLNYDIVSSVDVKLVDDKLVLYTYAGSTSEYNCTTKFDPVYIKGIFADTRNENVGSLFISFTGKQVKQTCFGVVMEPLDFYVFYFAKGDGTNGSKLRKAFLHLQALLKAEDDPFGKPE